MIRYTSTDLLNIAFRDEGSSNAPVVLLLHGWPDDPTTWDQLILQLTAAGYRVLAPWLRGYLKLQSLTDD